jgi:hypothetical protein
MSREYRSYKGKGSQAFREGNIGLILVPDPETLIMMGAAIMNKGLTM